MSAPGPTAGWAISAAAVAALPAMLWLRRGRYGRRELRFALAALTLAALAPLPGLGPWMVALPERLCGATPAQAALAALALALASWARRAERRARSAEEGLFALGRALAVDAALAIPREGLAPEIVVIMPALDEAESLPGVLAGAPSEVLGRSLRVLVVDDGSADDTAAVAARHGAISVRSAVNGGGGHALLIGFAAARRLGARWAVTMDADGQHRFEDLPALLAPLLAGEADVVVGSRRLGASIGHEALRAVGLRVFNLALSLITARRVTDCSSGLRAFDLHATRGLRLRQRRHHTAELLIEATRRGMRIVEVPITILPRAHGETKKGPNWLYGARFAGTITSTLWEG